MNSATQSVGGLFSISSLLAFLVGCIGTMAYYRLKCHWYNTHHPEGPRHVPNRLRSLVLLWAMIFMVTGYIGFQQQSTANEVRELSASTADCQEQFFVVLKTRSENNDRANEWSRRKSRAIADWLRAILFPPEDMAKLRSQNPNDPVYQRYAFDITNQYLQKIDQAEKEQVSALEDQKLHPLPEPTCGN